MSIIFQPDFSGAGPQVSPEAPRRAAVAPHRLSRCGAPVRLTPSCRLLHHRTAFTLFLHCFTDSVMWACSHYVGRARPENSS
jgi:hypothetical protein